MSLEQDLAKIEYALGLAREKAETFSSGRIEAELKAGGDPVTAADIEINSVLQEALVEGSDGWLSEETVDDLVRLEKQRVWIVDPVDGTREFVAGIDEWCISVALAAGGKVVAAGICSPSTDQLYLGSIETGVTLNGKPAGTTDRTELQGATVLASRSEVNHGQWDRFRGGPLEVIPMGSVAYKLARVSAGLADATFTLVPKNEWDIAAGTLLVEAGGGKVLDKDGNGLVFNREKTLLGGLVASGAGLFGPLNKLISGPLNAENK